MNPEKNSYWRHTTGNIYKVLDFTNENTTQEDRYPVTIIYID